MDDAEPLACLWNDLWNVINWKRKSYSHVVDIYGILRTAKPLINGRLENNTDNTHRYSLQLSINRSSTASVLRLGYHLWSCVSCRKADVMRGCGEWFSGAS
jgi:protein tyrosine phosphatase